MSIMLSIAAAVVGYSAIGILVLQGAGAFLILLIDGFNQAFGRKR